MSQVAIISKETQPPVNGWCRALNAVASVRRLGDDTPGQRGRHDNSLSSGKGDGRFSGPYSLQSFAATHIRSAVRSNGWAGRPTPEFRPRHFVQKAVQANAMEGTHLGIVGTATAGVCRTIEIY